MAGILNLVVVVGTAALSVRLFVTGLYKRYWAFFTFLIFLAVREGVVSRIQSDQRLYLHFYAYTEPVEWILYALVVMELYSLVLHDYRGLATVGRWALIAAVVLALGASALSFAAPSQLGAQGRWILYYYVAERSVYLSLVVFLLTMLGFLLQYPIQLNRNIIFYSTVFTVYFVSLAILFVVLTTKGVNAVLAQTVGYAVNAINIIALGIWLLMLNWAGEERKQSLRPAWMPGREEALVNQLNVLNNALLRATRK